MVADHGTRRHDLTSLDLARNAWFVKFIQFCLSSCSLYAYRDSRLLQDETFQAECTAIRERLDVPGRQFFQESHFSSKERKVMTCCGSWQLGGVVSITGPYCE